MNVVAEPVEGRAMIPEIQRPSAGDTAARFPDRTDVGRVVEITSIPCSRRGGGENDGRVALVLLFALGLTRDEDALDDAHLSIARLHDHDGLLTIAMRRDLPTAWKVAIRKAWSQVGFEFGQSTHFVMLDSPEWREVWELRDFESDWTS